MIRTFAVACLILFSVVWPSDSFAADRPNLLWITTEDMSPTLGCYGDEYATTPHLDALAERSLRFTHAFATAPVCSPSRSCLINGLPATSLGTQQMRSTFPIPNQMTGFPSLLRKSGYFTSNNSKTDYNIGDPQRLIDASWDRQGAQAHWRSRPANKPFFSVFNMMTTHQSRTMVWPYQQFVDEIQSKLSAEEIHAPDRAPIPPYYPDTPIVRKTVARYYDCVTLMDRQVGQLLAELESDGLADDTIIFFYSDHGSGMPRHKRALLDSGMRVPMLVHVPEKWQSLARAEPGQTTPRLVNFADFAPTVLNLAGIERPEYMEGTAFLGNEVSSPPRFIFGHRDRVDEVYDTARSVRGPRFLYIRNFQPHLGYNQVSAYSDLGEIRHEFYAAAKSGGLTKSQSHYVSDTRPVEELYDCVSDPLNLRSLVESDTHRETLRQMRSALQTHVIESKDLGFLPETLQWELSSGTTSYRMARDSYDIEGVYAAASDVGVVGESAFVVHLRNPNAAVRYWGAVGLTALPRLAAPALESLRTALRDADVAVRLQACDALTRHGHTDDAFSLLASALENDDFNIALRAARTVELLGDAARPLRGAMERLDAEARKRQEQGASRGDSDLAMFVGFSTGAFLSRVRSAADQ